MPLHQSDSIILKTYPLGEADRIVAFFSRDHGKMRGVANGARRMKNRFGASLEPLAHSRIQFFEKENRDLVRIQSAETPRFADEAFPGLRSRGLCRPRCGAGRSICSGARTARRGVPAGSHDSFGLSSRDARSSSPRATSKSGCCGWPVSFPDLFVCSVCSADCCNRRGAFSGAWTSGHDLQSMRASQWCRAFWRRWSIWFSGC